MNDLSERVGLAYTISEDSRVRLGMVALLICGVLWLVNTVNAVREDVAENFVHRDLFTLRMDGYSTQLVDLKEVVRARQESFEARVLSELQVISSQVRALDLRVETLRK